MILKGFPNPLYMLTYANRTAIEFSPAQRWACGIAMYACLGSEHTDLCLVTGAKKTFNTCEDLHDGFRAIPKGKDHSMLKASASLSSLSFFSCHLHSVHFFCIYLTKLADASPTCMLNSLKLDLFHSKHHVKIY